MPRFTSKMPYLLYVAILQLGLYCCLSVVYGGIVYGGSLSRPKFWLLLLPGLLLVSLYGFVLAILSLRTKGLSFSATVGELNEAKKRRELDRPTR
jgi:ABC-type branched-subunit amino acid transport system permease subunit